MKRGKWLFSFLIISVIADIGLTAEKCVSPEMCISYRVVDENGNPVPNVKCSGWIRQFDVKGGGRAYSLESDLKGIVTITGRCSVSFTAFFRKEGYYTSQHEPNLDADGSGSAIVDGKWQPYGETRTVVLKRIVDPHTVKTFGEKSYRHHIPVWEKWIGYDLEVNEWVAPYGAGKFSDVLLRFKADVRQRNRYFTYVMDVSFTNNPCAGAYPMKKDADSDLKSVHCANANGVFDAELTFSSESKPGVPVRLNYLDSNSYLIFRTRTQVDSKGNLLSAHYGKIYGSWRSNDEEMFINGGCFNPVENDTNIEGDMVLLYKIKNYKPSK